MHAIDFECLIWTSIVFNLIVVACYPSGRIEQMQLSAQKNEKHFPNGTVIGKYSYMDKEGNPVQVKYYADDASYGVELKSIKVVDTSSEPSTVTYLKDYPEKELISNIPDNILSTLGKEKNPKNDPFEFLTKEVNKIDHYKPDKSSPDFEIYYQNDLNGPKKCGKNKVRVYFDKKRKIRSIVNKLEADKYCEQF